MLDDDGSDEVLNLRQFEDATGGDAELMQELALLYLDDTAARFPTLEEAAARRDLESVGSVAHAMKGSSASIGADQAAEAFKTLEMIGRGARADGLDDAVAAARAAFEAVRQRLSRMAA
jgi:HPt (histidine-containing phosphotransfer) domain-containing protein